MHTRLHSRFEDDQQAQIAASVISACVHCGFCNATCPTYLDLGDERDGPRGRIYLIKQLLEEGSATRRTQAHLDRCLTCRNCETTCPSGVQYGQLLDVGRGILESDLRRPWREAVLRWLLKSFVPYPQRLGWALSLARAVRPLLPQTLRAKIPPKRTAGKPPQEHHERTLLLLEGCAQATITPATNTAAQRVFERLGISLVAAPQAKCCGALHYHMGEQEDGKSFMRANIDAWWPYIERGAEAIVVTASGCGVTVKEYGLLLADDKDYAHKAKRISALTRDISEVMESEDLSALQLSSKTTPYALHCPCTLQHGQQLGNRLEKLLTGLGMQLVDTSDGHLCCGSAGSYSILQPEISERLRKQKLKALTQNSPETILTANVGCQLHLASGTDVPVRHWIEILDYAATAHK